MSFLKQTQVPQVDLIVFGGSFDPPHLAHNVCIQLARKLFPAAKILVIPSYAPPQNLNTFKKLYTSFEERLEMCRIAFTDNGVEVLDTERHLPAPSFTYQTLEALQRAYPQKSLGFLIGLDQFLNFSTWKNPLSILKQASLIVIPRGRLCTEEDRMQFVKSMNLQATHQDAHSLHFPLCKPIFLAPDFAPALSSTELRKVLSEPSRQDILGSSLKAEVLSFIRKQHLYASKDT